VSKHQQHLLLFLAAIAGVGLLFWYGSRPEPVAVLASAAEMGVVEQTVANTRAGTVKACRRARLSPSIGGQIAVLDIHEGDQVKADKLLLELWNKDLTAEINLKEQEAKAAKANARAVCLQADEAQREADRLAKLKERGVISIESIDKANTAPNPSGPIVNLPKCQPRSVLHGFGSVVHSWNAPS
jgi:HlyD family secretion protein